MKSGMLIFVTIFLAVVPAMALHFEQRDLDDILWEKVAIQDSVESYRELHPKGRLVAIRGKCTINAPIDVVLTNLIATSYDSQKKWVPYLKEFKVIKINTLRDRILYVAVDIPWPAMDRDFLYKAKIEPYKANNEVVLNYLSTEIDSIKARHSIRGKMKTKFIIKKLGENKTSVDLRSLVDPGGAIPKWIVNLAQGRYSYNILSKLTKEVYSNRDSLNIPPEFKNILK